MYEKFYATILPVLKITSLNDPISLQVRYLGIKKLEEEACKFKEPLTTTEIHSATTETDHNNHGDQETQREAPAHG